MTKIELLAPAKNRDCGFAAINHGADAVYIGGPLFGARQHAGNSLSDIEELVNYAHRFHAKVYVAFNTVLFDHELEQAKQLIGQIYNTGADALIVQDMGILEMDLPPIALHASTQTDNRTPAKVEFLEKAGFEQVVLARELSLTQIAEIRSKTSVNLEFFIHGALCVSYSGQCYMSHAINGRSANRGECAQPCRLSYSLKDKWGNTLEQDKHLLSLKDLNLTNYLHDLAKTGITSFKIEGRLKDIDYVKNITSWYRQRMDEFMEKDTSFVPASSGRCSYIFTANPEKSFSRGFTDYFINDRKAPVWSPDSPKSLGQKIGRVARVEKDHFVLADSVHTISNGDGLCFLDKKQEMVGVRVNRSEGLNIFPANMNLIYAGAMLFRNSDKAFNDILEKSNDNRKITIELTFTSLNDSTYELSCTDEDGIITKYTTTLNASEARNPEAAIDQLKSQLSKFGGTIYAVKNINVDIDKAMFIPAKELNELRRTLIARHEENRLASYKRSEIVIAPNNHPFPLNSLNYKANITNKLSLQFYHRHGANNIEMGFEIKVPKNDKQVMTTKHCILHSMGKCILEHPEIKQSLPLTLTNAKDEYTLQFNCKACEMTVLLNSKDEVALH